MSEVAQTTKEVIEVVTTALQPLAEKLGTTAQYIWGLQVKQAYIDGFVALSGLLLGIGLLIVAFRVFKSFYHCRLEDEYDKFEVEKLTCILMFSLVGLLFLFLNFSTTVECFINPHHHALSSLIKLIK